jgi:fimbrial protein FimY
VSNHLHIAARKRRYRRICNGSPANPHGATVPIVFDRLEFLQQEIHAKHLREALDMVFVTSDNYLALALTQYLFKHQNTHVCTLLSEVEDFLAQNPLPRVLIDLDGINESIIHMLDTTRRWQKKCPRLSITLLTACKSRHATNLFKAASSFPVIERRQAVSELHHLLVRKQNVRECSPAPLSYREWHILLEVAKGESLKTIALSLKKPYHYVVYTIGKINARIGLDNNKALIHLLNNLSLVTTRKE